MLRQNLVLCLKCLAVILKDRRQAYEGDNLDTVPLSEDNFII